MNLPSALLLFPLLPGTASRAIEGRRGPLAAPAVVSAAAALYLGARGCRAGDAAATGGALLLLLGAMALGGAAACLVARRLLGGGRGFLAYLSIAALASAWTPPLFLFFSMVSSRFLSAAIAPLLSTLVLLTWGAVAGIGIVSGVEAEEGGKGLVASCIGLTGALAGLTLAAAIVTRTLLLVTHSPVDTEHFRAGEPLLVRCGSGALPGDYALVREGPGEAVRLRRVDGGPVAVRGRVFFRLQTGRALGER